MITYAIGDLHGRFDLFKKARGIVLTDFVKRKRNNEDLEAHFIILGNMNDNLPVSSQLLELIRTICDVPDTGLAPLELIPLKVLRGNHENMMINVLANPMQHVLEWWLGNGGGATLLSYGYKEGDKILPLKPKLEDDIRWLLSLPHYYETDKQVFVHAGVLPGARMKDQPTEVLTWKCYDEAYKWPEGATKPLTDADYPKHVVHGHEQWSDGPKLLKNRTDLDTFAWHTGRLAIGVFDDSQGAPIDILWAIGDPDKSP